MSPLDTAAESDSYPVNFSVGTGSQILSSILPTCISANYEVIIVTCFWAKSKSREDVSSMLRELSAKAIAQDRKIRVRLCMSSVSFVQKLLQTSSLQGMIYLPSKWENIGLPAPHELKGLDMVVKSVFVRPFSVMHPKFILVDREVAFMPSCNVSFEEWFEGCIKIKGHAVKSIFEFWQDFWGKGVCAVPKDVNFMPQRFDSLPRRYVFISRQLNIVSNENRISPSMLPRFPSLLAQRSFFFGDPISTFLLPSSHHKNPHFRPLTRSYPPPPTPLNEFLLRAINDAESSLYIQTPNLTCGPLIAAVTSALDRGINIHIVASRRMMVFEQLVTAATITEFEVWKMKRRYKMRLKQYNASERDPERAVPKLGTLKLSYFKVKTSGENGEVAKWEPVKSHLKLMIVDEKTVVLGSGNQDRASWYTSQELGIVFFSEEVAREVKATVEEGLKDRVEEYLK